MLGLNLNLPEGTLTDLENRRHKSLRNQQQREQEQGEQIDDKDDDDDSLFQEEVNTQQAIDDEDVDEDRMVMPFEPSSASGTSEEGNETGSNSNEDGSCTDGSESDDNDDDDEISVGPPRSLPLLVVDVEKLCGYTPEDESETKFLNDEISKALLGSPTASLKNDKEDNDDTVSSDNKGTNTMIGDGLSLDFMKRCCELFESGAARHSNTVSIPQHVKDDSAQAVISYPEFVLYDQAIPPPGSSEEQQQQQQQHFESTAKLWKAIIHPHKIPIVQRVLERLSNCSRDLIWKYEMSREIRHIAKKEGRYKKETVRRMEVDQWRTETRPAELAKLYNVRETFVLKLDAARERCEAHKRDREARVQRELQRRREKGIGTGGMAGLDWDGKVTFAFEDDVDDVINSMMGGKQVDYKSDPSSGYQESFSDNENDADEESYESSGDDDDDDKSALAEKTSQESKGTLTIPPSNSTVMLDRKKRRAVLASTRMRRKIKSENEKAKVNELRAKILAARDEESRIRETMINNDERMSVAIVLSLEKRLEQVDNLLETLQEEEWQDEEEYPSDTGEVSDQHSNHNIIEKPQKMSLLDQIMAMILGCQPVEGKNKQEHFKRLKLEHENIVQEWQLFFGRLPSVPVASGNNKEFDKQDSKNSPDAFDPSFKEGDADSLKSNSISKKMNSELSRRVTEHWEDLSDSEEETIPRNQNEGSTDSMKCNLTKEKMNSEPSRKVTEHWEDISDCEDDFVHVQDQTLPRKQIDQIENQRKIPKQRFGLRPGGKLGI